jgi:predicted CXXCH cytochrome family protein
LETIFFLRMPNEQSQLCMQCHRQQKTGPHNHPFVGMPQTVQADLNEQDVSAGPQGKVICQSCHTPHGSTFNNLLVADPRQNRLCLDCHEELQPELWKETPSYNHHRDQSLTDATFRKAIRNMGRYVGKNNTLACLSCHQMHEARTERHILADTLEGSRLCLRCHPDQSVVLETGHDLRKNNPEIPNLMGRTPVTDGPCSACHGAHQEALAAYPQPDDPQGDCRTCHAEGRGAGYATFESNDHPYRLTSNDIPAGVDMPLFEPLKEKTGGRVLGCQSCHQPHDNEHDWFLQQKHDALCSQCHSEHAESLAGAHDFTGHPGLKNADDYTAAEVGECGFCHTMHDAYGPVLWAANKTEAELPSDLCRSCHQAGGMAEDYPTHDLRHPNGPNTQKAVVEMASSLPLYNRNAHHDPNGFMTCSTCHQSHGDSTETMDLLYESHPQNTVAICLSCHKEVHTIRGSLHREDFLQNMQSPHDDLQSTAFCAPCHVTHVRPEMEAVGMWAAPIADQQYPQTMRKCLGCHGPAGSAKQVNVTYHPPVAMNNTRSPSSSGYMPLADEQGRFGSQGEITCQTCHLPHGRELQETKSGAERVSSSELQSLKPMIRAYQPPNLCSSCHGFAGLQLYLYYHKPQERTNVNLIPDKLPSW